MGWGEAHYMLKSFDWQRATFNLKTWHGILEWLVSYPDSPSCLLCSFVSHYKNSRSKKHFFLLQKKPQPSSQNNIYTISLSCKWVHNMLLWDLLYYAFEKQKDWSSVSVYLLPNPSLLFHWEHLNNIITKCGTELSRGSRWVGCRFGCRHTASCFSSGMYTDDATLAGRSEVDGFAEGGGKVCFSERLRHSLQEDKQRKRGSVVFSFLSRCLHCVFF